VSVHQDPRRNPGLHRYDQLAQMLQEILPVTLIPKDRSPLYPSDHHMVKRPWGIESCRPWHNNLLSQIFTQSKVFVFINVP
jgi:hypothetical protein